MGRALVLGCGDVGFSVASGLNDKNVEVVMVDRDAERVRTLRSMGRRAVVGDFGLPETLREAGIESAKVVFICVPEILDIRRALTAINHVKAELGISPIVLAMVYHEDDVIWVKRLGASAAVPRVQVLAEALLRKLDELLWADLRDVGVQMKEYGK